MRPAEFQARRERAEELARGELSPIDRRGATTGPLLMVGWLDASDRPRTQPYRTVADAFAAACEHSLALGYVAAAFEGPGSVAEQARHRPHIEWGNLEDIEPQGPTAAEMRAIRAAGGLWAYQDSFRR